MMVISVFVTSGKASIGMFRNVIMPPTNKPREANKIKYFRFNENAKAILCTLQKNSIRCSFDYRSEKIGKKIRDAEIMKTPYMLLLGEKEIATNSVAVRKHGQGDLGTMRVEDFVNTIKAEVEAVFL